MRKVLILALLLAGPITSRAGGFQSAAPVLVRPQLNECVVLLHGLGHTTFSMRRAEEYLRRQGYDVINAGYPIRGYTAQEVCEKRLAEILKDRIPSSATKIHFVTHSFGGIVVREYLANHQIENLGRVVMLAPPNHGSVIVDRLREHPFWNAVGGPALRELGTSDFDLPQTLGPVQFDCGVIAGDRSRNPLLARWLTGPNDGKVTVESARVEGMRDFVVLHSTHTWMAWRERTLKQTVSFLKNGHFERDTAMSVKKD